MRKFGLLIIAICFAAAWANEYTDQNRCAIEVCYDDDTLHTTHAMDSAVMLRHPEFSSVEATFAYLSTIKDCDKILVINEGTISGYDTHNNLIKNNSVYQKLYKKELIE